MDDRLVQIQKLLDAADGNLSTARTMMRELASFDPAPLDMDKKLENVNAPSSEGTVVEGVFDGEQMVAPDDKTYPVPPNYASKSKLVEGDTLKLTIADDGSFVFKQIAPVDRRNAIGTLAQADGNYTISAEGKSYKVLTASVTFYKAEPGDQVTILLPKEHDAVWAVLENVIKKGSDFSLGDSEKLETDSSQQVSNDNEDTTPAVIPEEVVVPEPEQDLPMPPMSSLNEVKDPEILRDTQNDNINTPIVPEIPKTPAPLPTNTPEIEFPNGETTISDEQLLENLKNNLKNLDQPAYTPAGETTPKPVDNIVASDLEQINKQSTINNQQPVVDDKPIAELDI